jgi:hypothetical protein
MPDEGGNAWLGSPRFLPWPAGRPVLFPLRRSGRPDDTGLQAIGSLVGTLGGSFCGCPVGNPEGLFLLPSGPTAYSNFSAAASLAPSSPFGTSPAGLWPGHLLVTGEPRDRPKQAPRFSFALPTTTIRVRPRDRLRDWACEIRTQKCRGKLSL